MERDGILAKNRAENKNRDVYEQEIMKQANSYALALLGCHVYYLVAMG